MRAIVRSIALSRAGLTLAACGATGPWLGNTSLPYLYKSADGRYVQTAPEALTWKSPTDGPAGPSGGQGPMGRSQRSEAPADGAPVVASWQSAEDISFEADRADIMPRCAQKIELLAAWVRTHPMFDVALDARSDEGMTGETDPRLGERRVSAVREALVAAGVTPARIRTAAFGDRRRPRAQGTPTCDEHNRRPEVFVGLRK